MITLLAVLAMGSDYQLVVGSIQLQGHPDPRESTYKDRLHTKRGVQYLSPTTGLITREWDSHLVIEGKEGQLRGAPGRRHEHHHRREGGLEDIAGSRCERRFPPAEDPGRRSRCSGFTTPKISWPRAGPRSTSWRTSGYEPNNRGTLIWNSKATTAARREGNRHDGPEGVEDSMSTLSSRRRRQ